MHRRQSLKALAGAAAVAAAQAAPGPIQLHVDLEVDPSKEKALVENFRKVFHPVISRQPGFVDVKLLELRQAVAGPAPSNMNYRLLISFQTEKQRQAWVRTDEHQRAWPSIEENLRGVKYTAVLYDVV